jgi:peptidoglycan hydrolase-like protein with peptidoglycan-binding domain
MQLRRILISSTLLLATAIPSFAMTHARRGPTSPRLFSHRNKAGSRHTSQTCIDSARTTQIQTALIKSGYLAGEPTGSWDPSTESAMQKLQADNGWQTKLVPDSRAIIKLGLGPNSNIEETSTVSTPAVRSLSRSAF